MRKVTIIGAGQAGLQLALGLLQKDYHVTLVTQHSAEQIASGPVLSTQCMFNSALDTERKLNINLWENDTPPISAINLCVTQPDACGNKAFEWKGELKNTAQSVDQRLKISQWMVLFKQQGGVLVIKDVTPADLERYAQASDLLIVASGKGKINGLFDIDTERSRFDKPQRNLSLLYVTPAENEIGLNKVSNNVIPGVGEFFIMPALSQSGPCECMLFEAIPEGPMDCFNITDTPEQRLEKAKALLLTYLPWEAARLTHSKLTDENATLLGAITPVVKKPVAKLPSNHLVLGLADAVCLNDPITGQGSNNASKAADVYLNRIIAHGDNAFDEKWMADTFEQFWLAGQWSTKWTNTMLSPPEHVINLLGAASQFPVLADRIVNGFDNPSDLYPWFENEDAANQYLAQLAQGEGV